MDADVSVREAYGSRAAEYAAALGSVDQLHADDRDRIGTWGRRLEGPVLDVGCGPGQWTDYLHHQGVDIRGIDPVRGFIAHARKQFPDVRYRTASLRTTDVETASLAGMLCWYSLIHIPPEDMARSLVHIHRLLRPGGEVLVGFFRSPRTEVFPHAVAPAYRWSVDHFTRELHGAGFNVCDIHRRTDPGVRPHASVRAAKPRLGRRVPR